MTRYSLLILVCVAVAAGCATAPAPKYYTLDMRGSGTPGGGVNIDVDRVQVSEALERNDILVKPTPTEVEYYASHQWVASVDDLVEEKLETEFGPHKIAQPTVVLMCNVLAFQQIDTPEGAGAQVKIEVSFRTEDMGRHEKPLLKKIYAATPKAEGEAPGSVVVALSKALSALAEEIMQDAAALVK